MKMCGGHESTPALRCRSRKWKSTLVLLPIAVTFHCSGQLRPGFLGIVQRFRKGVPVTGSESDRLFFRQDLPGSFLSSAEQESAYRHPRRRGRPDNQFLDFRRCAQINTFVGLGSSRHGRLAFITEEIRLIVVRWKTARNSNRTSLKTRDSVIASWSGHGNQDLRPPSLSRLPASRMRP